MKFAENQKRRALVFEARDELRRELRREPKAREVLRRVDQKDQLFARKWVSRQDDSDRVRTVRLILGAARPAATSLPGSLLLRDTKPIEGEPASRARVVACTRNRSSRLSPLWPIGPKQRNDLGASYSPVAADYPGTHLPSVLNRGRLPVLEIECRIGPKVRLYANEVLPGERGELTHPKGSALVYVADLFGGLFEISSASHSDPERTYPELRLEYELRYRYGDGHPRRLVGDLFGNVRRGFYRFEVNGELPTPLYG